MPESTTATQPKRATLVSLVALSQVLGVTTLVLIGIWVRDLGGFAWSGKAQFNWHPFLMVLSLLYLYGTSSLVYRVFPNSKKIYVKILHASLHGLAIIGIIVGLVAVFEFHNSFNIPNLYSLHSWIGIITVALFGLQFIFGFVTFLFPGFREEIKAFLLPYHRFLGNAILVLAGVTMISGLTEKLLFSLADTYKNLPSAGLIANFSGLFVVLFVVLVLYILNNQEWRRKETEESGQLLRTDP